MSIKFFPVLNILHAILIILISVNLARSEEKPRVESSALSAGEVLSYIEDERKLLRGNFKVDLAKEFGTKSWAEAKRYNNLKYVLNLKGLSFSGEDISRVMFTMSNMNDVSLKGANASDSDFVYVDFEGADLREANFSRADLSNALFVGVDLEGAIFDGANLFRATFDKVKGIDDAELAKLKKRALSYVNLEREPLPDYYNFDEEENANIENTQ